MLPTNWNELRDEKLFGKMQTFNTCCLAIFLLEKIRLSFQLFIEPINKSALL